MTTPSSSSLPSPPSSAPPGSGAAPARSGAHRGTDVALLLVALVWGTSYLAAKDATDVLPVPVVLLARYGVAAVACAAVVLARPGRRLPTRNEAAAGTLLGVTQAAVLVLETYGVAHTTAANAGLLISLTIMLTPVLDSVGGRRLPGAFFAAAGLCVAAVGLLVSGSGAHRPGAGDLLVLAAAAVRAGHVVLVGRCAARRPLRPLHLTAVQLAVGTALLAVPAAASGAGPRLAAADARTWTALACLGLLCSVFAFLAQTWAVQRTSATRASLLLGTEPVWAALAGVGLGGDPLTAATAAGAALMVAGTYWGQGIERAHRVRESGRAPAERAAGQAP
jgi:drug/metabolite transporter (DMT)-like permease